MPQNVERLLQRFKGGVQVGKPTAASATFTEFDTVGRQTMSGCARVYKEIVVRPNDFQVPLGNFAAGASPGTENTCGAGSLFSSCVAGFSIASSAFNIAATGYTISALNMGVGASPGSALWALAFVPKPLDAASSGSLIAIADWTYGSAPATAGSKTNLRVALAYIDSLKGGGGTANTRTAASVGGANASFVGTTACVIQTTCLGALPSFGASDSGALLVLRVGASAAADTGILSTGEVFVTNVRIRYLSDSLGTQSTE